MTIKTAKPEDFENVIKFYYDLIEDMQGAEFHPRWERDVYPTRQFISDAIEKNELFIALSDDCIVGAMVINHECVEGYDKVSWTVEASDDKIVVIHILGVSSRHQKQGIAKKMLAYAIENSRQKGMKAIRLDVLTINKPAMKLYSAAGFTYIDAVKLFYEDTGVTDFLLYEFAL